MSFLLMISPCLKYAFLENRPWGKGSCVTAFWGVQSQRSRSEGKTETNKKYNLSWLQLYFSVGC